MDLAALFSGGKDSCFAVYEALRMGHRVRYLVTIYPENPESYLFHCPNIRLTGLQARAMGIRHVTRESRGEKERELKDLELALRPLKDIDGVVTGGMASRYQAERVGSVCKKLGLRLLSPLWGMEPERYWGMLLESGFRVMIAGVSCQGLGREWLGRVVDPKALEELKALGRRFRFHLGFEGGEAETFVLDAPIFKKKIRILKARREWHGDSGYYRIERAKLEGKQP